MDNFEFHITLNSASPYLGDFGKARDRLNLLNMENLKIDVILTRNQWSNMIRNLSPMQSYEMVDDNLLPKNIMGFPIKIVDLNKWKELEINDAQPSIHLLRELSKASRVCGNLSERLEIAENFIRKIITGWECDPNHASAIMNELERLKKK